MNRITDIVKSGQLFFVNQVYPKYVKDNLIRKFKPSYVLKATLVLIAAFSTIRYVLYSIKDL